MKNVPPLSKITNFDHIKHDLKDSRLSAAIAVAQIARLKKENEGSLSSTSKSNKKEKDRLKRKDIKEANQSASTLSNTESKSLLSISTSPSKATSNLVPVVDRPRARDLSQAQSIFDHQNIASNTTYESCLTAITLMEAAGDPKNADIFTPKTKRTILESKAVTEAQSKFEDLVKKQESQTGKKKHQHSMDEEAVSAIKRFQQEASNLKRSITMSGSRKQLASALTLSTDKLSMQSLASLAYSPRRKGGGGDEDRRQEDAPNSTNTDRRTLTSLTSLGEDQFGDEVGSFYSAAVGPDMIKTDDDCTIRSSISFTEPFQENSHESTSSGKVYNDNQSESTSHNFRSITYDRDMSKTDEDFYAEEDDYMTHDGVEPDYSIRSAYSASVRHKAINLFTSHRRSKNNLSNFKTLTLKPEKKVKPNGTPGFVRGKLVRQKSNSITICHPLVSKEEVALNEALDKLKMKKNKQLNNDSHRCSSSTDKSEKNQKVEKEEENQEPKKVALKDLAFLPPEALSFFESHGSAGKLPNFDLESTTTPSPQPILEKPSLIATASSTHPFILEHDSVIELTDCSMKEEHNASNREDCLSPIGNDQSHGSPVVTTVVKTPSRRPHLGVSSTTQLPRKSKIHPQQSVSTQLRSLNLFSCAKIPMSDSNVPKSFHRGRFTNPIDALGEANSDTMSTISKKSKISGFSKSSKSSSKSHSHLFSKTSTMNSLSLNQRFDEDLTSQDATDTMDSQTTITQTSGDAAVRKRQIKGGHLRNTRPASSYHPRPNIESVSTTFNDLEDSLFGQDMDTLDGIEMDFSKIEFGDNTTSEV